MPIFPLSNNLRVTSLPLSNQRGQGLIEYLIVVALIAVATIGVMRFVGQSVTSKFAEIGYALDGEKKEVAIEKPDETVLRKRHLGDFMNGVGKNGQGNR